MSKATSKNNVKYPQISVSLIGMDGNAFAIIGQIKNALKNFGVDNEEINNFYKEATAKDYNHLLNTVLKWVNVK